jgi:hypothetical protein
MVPQKALTPALSLREREFLALTLKVASPLPPGEDLGEGFWKVST